jgi:hypothetical protein
MAGEIARLLSILVLIWSFILSYSIKHSTFVISYHTSYIFKIRQLELSNNE